MNLGGTVRLNRTGWLLGLLVVLIILFAHFSRRESVEIPESEYLSVRSLLIGAIEAAQLGGIKIIAASESKLNIEVKGKTKEGIIDPVTNADYASHCEMYHSLLKAFPKVNIKSEESHAKSCPEPTTLKLDIESIANVIDRYFHPHDLTIWIDPLDATKEYTENLHQYVTTMVCVALKGVPIIGVIHKPFANKTSWATYTGHASSDLRPLTNTEESKSFPRVIVSMSHKGIVEKFAQDAFGNRAHLTSAAGSGYKVLEVAHDNQDVYIHTTLIKKWDICAGNAIINALGGRMTTKDNSTIDYSFNSEVTNEKGLIASIKNHNYYIEKAKSLHL